MKQKDIALIAVIAIVTAVFSFILANFLITPSSERQAEVEVVKPITSDFQELDNKYYNDRSNNPTQIIRIGGEEDNNDPFSNPGQD